LLLTLFFLSSCGNGAISHELKRFMGSSITIPDGLIEITKGEISSSEEVRDTAVLVIYRDRGECSSCLVAHMYNDLSMLQEIASKGKCRVMVILSPPEDEVQDAIKGIVELDFPFPIYVDQHDDFGRMNPSLPEDDRFHSFLMNREGHPICVGDPLTNDRVYPILVKALDEL